MTDVPHARLKELFAAASELSGIDRARYLDEACAGDVALRHEIESLLAHADRPGHDMDAAGAALRSDATFTAIPERIAGYRILRPIGSGGMGVVLLAEQDSPRRTVAIKLVRPGFISEKIIRRFARESQALGMLQHPSIAQVFEAGTAEIGRAAQPFFAMEYIEGEPLTRYAMHHDLDLRRRLELFVQICDAVQHAHDRGVIHRDLKPANVLVTADGRPKILDFGVARLIERDTRMTTLQTHTGEIVGTLAYMSPEQVSGAPATIDARTDVYALGAMLFELLSERHPHDLAGRSLPEAIRMIGDAEPASLASIHRTFRGDLNTIVAKAIARDPHQRYDSAQALAADLRRFLNDQPIIARPPSTIYQLRKFTRRHKALVGATVTVLMVSVLGAISALNFAFREQHQRHLAEVRTAELEQVTAFQASLLEDIDAEQMGRAILDDVRTRAAQALADRGVEPAEAVQALAGFDHAVAGISTTDLALKVIDDRILMRAVRLIDEEFADDLLIAASLRQSIGNTYRAIGLLESAIPLQQGALDTRIEVRGPTHPETFESHLRLGYSLRELGRYEEALPHVQTAENGFRAAMGDLHPSTLRAINDRALLSFDMGEFEAALAQFRQAYDGRRSVLGAEDIETLETGLHIAAVLQQLGRDDEAEQQFRSSVESHLRELGEDHPATQNARMRLALLLRASGRFDEALPFAESALAGYQRIFGQLHQSTLSACNLVGLIMLGTGDTEQGLVLLMQALDGTRRTLGEDHPSTIGAINNLGYFMFQLGRLEESAEYTRQAVDSYRRVLGPAHPKTILTSKNLARLYQRMDRLDEAAHISREVLMRSRESLGEDHPETFAAIERLADVLRSSGQLEEARRLGAEAVQAALAAFPENDRQIAPYLISYGRTLTALNQSAEAEQSFLRAHAILQAALGEQDPATIAAADALAEHRNAQLHAAPRDQSETEAQK